MFNLPGWLFTVIALVLTLFVIGLIFARLYRRASAEQAFVRTGLGGQKEWRCNCYAHFSRNNSRQHEHPEAGSQSCSG